MKPRQIWMFEYSQHDEGLIMIASDGFYFKSDWHEDTK